MTLITYHSSAYLGHDGALLTLSPLVMLQYVCIFSVSIHSIAEIECSVIDMIQLRNIRSRAYIHGYDTIHVTYMCMLCGHRVDTMVTAVHACRIITLAGVFPTPVTCSGVFLPH